MNKLKFNKDFSYPELDDPDFLSKIFPITEHLNTSVVRVFVTDDSSIRQFALQSGTWTWQANL